MSERDPEVYLKRLGEQGEGPHDIARAALMLSVLDHPGRLRAPYEAHLDELAAAGKDELRLIYRAEEAGRALSALIAGRYGYDGDRISYDDSKNADLMAVIDRRRGMPVALGILYIHVARAAGIEACGLNTPAHFLLRIDVKSSSALIDPFNGGAVVERERLASLPGIAVAVPDEAGFGEPVSDSAVLLRLENNLKVRALQSGDRTRGLEIAHRMVLIAPERAELWAELARLNEQGGSLGAAKRAYETCLTLAKPGEALHNEAALAFAELKRRLN